MRPSLAGFAILLAAASPAVADCTCRLAGASLPHGSVACIRLGGQPSLYVCDKALNVSSWRKLSEGCPVSVAPPAAVTPADRPLALAFRFAPGGPTARP